MIRLPDCKLLAQGHRCQKTKPEVTNWSVTSTSHQFGLVAQSAERPVVCGRGPCGRPPGCNSLRVRHFFRSVVQSSERSAWDREVVGGNPAIPINFKLLPWSNTSGIRLLNGTMQVGILSAAPLPDSVKVARRPVKPLVLVRVQVWQPFFRV